MNTGDPGILAENVYRVFERIRRYDPTVNAYIDVETEDYVHEYTRRLERKAGRGERLGRLAGWAVAVKDNIWTERMYTRAASRMLEGFRAPENATVVDRLLAEDALVIGKTNMDEFAMGSTGENSAYGPTRNPWSLEHVPGGSSSGSAAAIAYGGARVALGSDTGGSVRIPAAYTWTVALKPTYGLVSRYGLIPYANSLEQISPMARTIQDLSTLLDVIKGHDPRDATSLGWNGRIEIATLDPRRVRVAIPREMVETVDEGVENLFWSLVSRLESLGVEFDLVSVPVLRYALPAYYAIALAEASSNLARYDGVLHGKRPRGCGGWEDCISTARGRFFGGEVKARIILGGYVLMKGYRSELYAKATILRRMVRDAVLALLKEYDFIGSPAVTSPPPRLGERLGDPEKMAALDMITVTANLSGVPALAQPMGFADGLPVGVQWMSQPLSEPRLLGIGDLVEEVVGVKTPVDPMV